MPPISIQTESRVSSVWRWSVPEPGMRSGLRWRVVAAFAAIYGIWGSTYLAIRFAIETVPPFLMAGARFTVAGTVLYAWARQRGAPRPTGANWAAGAAVGALLLVGGNGGLVWAEQRIPSGLAALLAGLVPLWIVLLDWLRPGGVRPGGVVVAGLAFGFAGMALLVGPGNLIGGQQVDAVGALVVALATLLWAAGSLYSRRAALPASPLLATSLEMLAGGALLLLAAAITGEAARFHPGAVSLRSLLACGYLIVFGSLVGFTAYGWLLREVPAARVSTYAYVNPVVAVVLGWALAGEPLSGRTLAAAAIIVTGVVLITTYQARHHVPAAIRLAPGGPPHEFC